MINSVYPVINGQHIAIGTDVLSVTSSNNTLSNLAIRGGPRDALVVTGNNNYIGPQAKLLAAGRYGIRVSGDLYSGLPIDLGNDGHTPNDPGDADPGPNTLLN